MCVCGWVGGCVYYAGEKEWASMLNNIQRMSSHTCLKNPLETSAHASDNIYCCTLQIYIPWVQSCMVIHLLYTVEKITI